MRFTHSPYWHTSVTYIYIYIYVTDVYMIYIYIYIYIISYRKSTTHEECCFFSKNLHGYILKYFFFYKSSIIKKLIKSLAF